MSRTGSRPRRSIVTWRAMDYAVDLDRCNRALVDLQLKGTVGGIGDLARTAGVSRYTVSRFLNGRGVNTTPAAMRAIIAALGLEFDEVVQPLRSEPLQ